MMAREKRKETLTLEERLQAALVPDLEQPYKVPENWCWTYLGNVSDIVTGGTPSKKNPEYYGGTFPFFKPADLDSGRHVVQASEYLSDEGKSVSRIVPEQSTAVCCIGSIGKAGFLEVSGTTNQQINSAIPKFNPLYLYYFCNTNFFVDELWKKASATTISIVNKSKMESCMFPLPPLSEQQSIVDRIESLFAKLDEAKQRVQDALDSFETRKAAILHKAFKGELTIQWRKEHGMVGISWKETILGNYVDSQYGYTESASQEQIGPKFLRITDIKNGMVNWDDVPYCKISDSDFDKYAVCKNDIMIARTGATTGKSCLVVDDVEAVFASYLIRIKIKSSELLPQYLYYFLQSQMYWSQITKFSAGIAQPGVNAKKLKKIIFPIAAVPEQIEVVRILDDIFAKEQQAKEAAETVMKQIDLTQKSILTRAFRGELGTNDPNEESSIALLKRSFLETIESEKVKPQQVTKQKKEVGFMRKTIIEVLSKGVRLTPEKLKSETQLPIDDFYAQLKELIDHGSVVENRENGESYLEAVNENRQTEN